VITSSVIPSAKYSCSGSPLMFRNAKTAIEGLSGGAGTGVLSGAAGLLGVAVFTSAATPTSSEYARIGWVMFLSWTSPISLTARSSLALT
jgi:hypothetical protein